MTDLWLAHLGFALLLFSVLAWAGPRGPLQVVKFLACLAIGLVPINDMSLALYVRSFTDDLAIGTLVLMGALLLSKAGVAPLRRIDLQATTALFALFALLLYPATLGLSYIDPYRYGFDPRPLLLAGAALALVLLQRRNWLGVAMLALPTLAFALHLKSSGNYWDYLIDPLLALYCCVRLLGFVLQRGHAALRARRSPPTPLPAGSTLPVTEVDK